MKHLVARTLPIQWSSTYSTTLGWTLDAFYPSSRIFILIYARGILQDSYLSQGVKCTGWKLIILAGPIWPQHVELLPRCPPLPPPPHTLFYYCYYLIIGLTLAYTIIHLALHRLFHYFGLGLYWLNMAYFRWKINWTRVLPIIHVKQGYLKVFHPTKINLKPLMGAYHVSITILKVTLASHCLHATWSHL